LTSENYQELVDMYNSHKHEGLQIFGFPCGQFMNQELSSGQEIRKFIDDNFEVSFPMFSKIQVNGPDTHPIFKYLKYNSVQMNTEKGLANIPWNFAKFLVDKNGKVIGFYQPNIKPKDMMKDIEALLRKGT
jgi:glutathione peroxidase